VGGKAENPGRGDAWLRVSLDPASKAGNQMADTGGRHGGRQRPLLTIWRAVSRAGCRSTSNKLESYAPALRRAFGDRMDYAQEEKEFQAIKVEGPEWQKYRVSPLVGVSRVAIHGKSNLRTSTVSHTERFFLTVRQGNKRTARKTLAYSKLCDNHGGRQFHHGLSL